MRSKRGRFTGVSVVIPPDDTHVTRGVLAKGWMTASGFVILQGDLAGRWRVRVQLDGDSIMDVAFTATSRKKPREITLAYGSCVSQKQDDEEASSTRLPEVICERCLTVTVDCIGQRDEETVFVITSK